jgi:hypothetical protein
MLTGFRKALEFRAQIVVKVDGDDKWTRNSSRSRFPNINHLGLLFLRGSVY